jgi:FMN phosphatase YigB (HAD superfamily)
MVYVDDAGILWRGKKRYHMTADSLAELHGFAEQVGINKCWFHRGTTHPHYDITEPQRQAVLDAGGVAVTQRELLRIATRLHRPAS